MSGNDQHTPAGSRERGSRDGLHAVDNRGDHNCFGCGPHNPAGLQMKFWSDYTHVFSWVTIPEHMCGWDNLAHGGVISTILDEIMSWSAIHLLKTFILTKSITVDFVRPIRVGSELKAVGRVLKRESARQALMQGCLYDTKEILCARSEGTFALLEPKIARKLGIMSEAAINAFERIIGA